MATADSFLWGWEIKISDWRPIDLAAESTDDLQNAIDRAVRMMTS